MKITAILLALLVAVVWSAVLYLKYRMRNTPDEKNLAAAIDAKASKFVNQGLSPGLVVGVYKDGRSFIRGYGTVNKDGAAAPGATTIFQIASVSKLFTASLLQALCDEGIVSMDATLGELMGRSMPLSSAAQRVTLKQLATHTSGFPRIPKSLEVEATKMMGEEDPMLDPYSYLGPQFIFAYLATTQDKREAGRFEYSNFGMGLLGHVLEIVTGQNYESLVTEKVLVPLEMTETAITLTAEMRDRLAQGYATKGAATRRWQFAALAGAGALHSNAQDLLRFVRANVEEGAPLSASLEKMREPQFGGDTGIGWMQATFLDKFFGNGKVVWHNGMVGGYASYLSVDAQTRTGTVILANRAVDVTMLGMVLTRQVRTQSWSAPAPSKLSLRTDTQ